MNIIFSFRQFVFTFVVDVFAKIVVKRFFSFFFLLFVLLFAKLSAQQLSVLLTMFYLENLFFEHFFSKLIKFWTPCSFSMNLGWIKFSAIVDVFKIYTIFLLRKNHVIISYYLKKNEVTSTENLKSIPIILNSL